MLYTIHFPCFTFVKKYLESKYGSPIHIKKKDKFGKLVILALERYPKRFDKAPDLGDSIPLQVSEDIYCKKGLFLSKDSILAINDLIYDELFDEICNYLNNINNNLGIKRYDTISIKYHIKQKRDHKTISKKIKRPDLNDLIEVRNVIEEIIQKYGLTFEDLTFESLHRAYYRHKDKNKLLKAS